MNLIKFIEQYPDEQSCKDKIKELRYKNGVKCAKCGCNKHYWKKDKEMYECSECGLSYLYYVLYNLCITLN